MTFHELFASFYKMLGPGAGALLFVGSIVLIVELEQLIQYIIKRVRKNCPPKDKNCKDE